MKSEIQKCLAGELFNTSNEQSQTMIGQARDLTRKYNATQHSEKAERRSILEDLFDELGTNVTIDTPFYCDYGKHTTIGNNVIININCIFVDCNRITIGDNVLIASNVQICTATHPVHPSERLVENWDPQSDHPYFRTYAQPVTIEDNAWIGAGVTILPGVTIGKNAVIGAGSVVTRSIPPDSLAVGNPCKVIRNVNEERR
ncbi:sugar O-acetyltransferase [Pelagicoccus mobilis]|uniref:Nodulation protein L n=1 Tax=Pelagicoccus mobilis TaxID=415221 RepID=A0A934VNX6_9BACT|nr:sugar O-acetyltransferase [Pelagicoccus mobilis]MBK1880416.1 sugar O-acetyltransferase [Pelagicoccus mobilis]